MQSEEDDARRAAEEPGADDRAGRVHLNADDGDVVPVPLYRRVPWHRVLPAVIAVVLLVAIGIACPPHYWRF